MSGYRRFLSMESAIDAPNATLPNISSETGLLIESTTSSGEISEDCANNSTAVYTEASRRHFDNWPVRQKVDLTSLRTTPISTFSDIIAHHVLDAKLLNGETRSHMIPTTGLMRSLVSPSRLLRPAGTTTPPTLRLPLTTSSRPPTCNGSSSPPCLTPSTHCRCYAHSHSSRHTLNQNTYFQASPPSLSLTPNPDHPQQPPSPRTLQLGRTIRTLHSRLPTLLLSPLPSDILSPNITLHLFPSTHPHLPAVSGRIAYVAALWTAPVAWGRIPLVGNVGLEILSERMVRGQHLSSYGGTEDRGGDERLVVKWRTRGKSRLRGNGGGGRGGGSGVQSPPRTQDLVEKPRAFVSPSSSSSLPSNRDEEFTGIFIFEFDTQGKILKHVIEHTEENGHGRECKTTRVVSVTDWLLGGFRKKGEEQEGGLGLALCVQEGGSFDAKKRSRG